MDRRYVTGITGEAAAEQYLISKGMTCLARRYRAMDGEVDLVMDDGGVIVFIEVKSRPRGRHGEGLMAVTPAKQRRITHAAGAFLMEREWFGKPVRFDVVELCMDGLYHVPNAFQPSAWM
ncbi:MAG: YraN family protein [Clostridia bacterium]|nr:YraN family protein [Clostridia bacterium]